MTKRRVIVGLGTLALLLSCSSGSSSTTPPPPPPTGTPSSTVFVGDVDGGKALIAVVRGPDSVVAYTCGIGPALATHTGWFFDAAAGALADRVGPATSAGGLELTGHHDGTNFTGTLKLLDGSLVTWTAQPARGGAGLYQNEDAAALTGLIIANDGRTAGNTRLKVDGIAGTTTTMNTSTAVTVTSPPPTSPTPVTTTFPVATTTRVITLQPVLSPEIKTITKPSPTIIFLVHGMSDSIDTNATSEDLVKCEGIRNTPFYSRCEWGIDFIPGLFGTVAAKSGQLVNLAGKDVSGQLYLSDPSNRPLIDENLGITARDARGCVTDPNAVESYDDAIAQHLVTVAPLVPNKPPLLSVFATWRDSTKGVVESGRRVANQAYAAVRWFEKQYRQTPKVIFVVQSFGGLATRFLLSNAPNPDFDTPLLNADHIPVCPEEHGKMDYLRDRTVFALSLATPHEGSFMSEWGEPPKAFLRAALMDLQAGLSNNALARLLRATDEVTPLLLRSPNLVARAQVEIPRLLRLLDTPALREMKLATMVQYNTGPLSPDRARRTTASPIVGAQGKLIPIYATLGRSPGGAAFNSPDILAGFDRFNQETEKEKNWIIGTMWLSDLLVKQFVPDGFGRVDMGGPLSAHVAILDRTQRLFDLSSLNKDAEDFVRQALQVPLDSLATYFIGKFGAGFDGVLAFLRAQRLQVFLPNAVVPVAIDRKWVLDLSGSVQVPELALACAGAQPIVLDYDPLARALITASGSTEAALTTLAGKNPTELVQAAGGVIEDGATLAGGVLTWMIDKVSRLGTAPDGCALPTDPTTAVTQFYKAANIVNWKLVRTMGPVPAPAWHKTDTLVHDGEMDDDGVVHAASALGLQLGVRPFFFEHDRPDGPLVAGKPTFGSWYRLPDNPVTEKYNHGMQYQNDVGRWISQTFLVPAVGPVPSSTSFSAWP